MWGYWVRICIKQNLQIHTNLSCTWKIENFKNTNNLRLLHLYQIPLKTMIFQGRVVSPWPIHLNHFPPWFHGPCRVRDHLTLTIFLPDFMDHDGSVTIWSKPFSSLTSWTMTGPAGWPFSSFLAWRGVAASRLPGPQLTAREPAPQFLWYYS